MKTPPHAYTSYTHATYLVGRESQGGGESTGCKESHAGRRRVHGMQRVAGRRRVHGSRELHAGRRRVEGVQRVACREAESRRDVESCSRGGESTRCGGNSDASWRVRRRVNGHWTRTKLNAELHTSAAAAGDI